MAGVEKQDGLPGWLPSLDALQVIVEAGVWVGAIAQTIFLAMWLTLPWWREWVGRALMVKSLALGVYLDSVLIHEYLVPDYAAEPYVRTLLFLLIVLGICSQVVALGYEMVKARRQKRGVTGTDHHDDQGTRIPRTTRI